ncbi:MAG: ISNCY family transposase [Bryobacteraceae bacterium]|jgi:IS5 family transposase
MIDLRRPRQRSFGEGLIEEETASLWEPWMRQADLVLEDEKLVSAVYEALVKRRPKSRTRGRRGVAAEIVLRMMLLKHIRNWSFEDLEREVRPNLLYREFTRVGSGKVPDAKTLGRQAQALGPEVVEQIHRRMVELAVENKVVQGRKMRVDTTVVETNIHYPTDSSLLGDGDRVLTRLMKKVTAIAGAAGAKLRNRMRSVQRRVAEIARASRAKGDKLKQKVPPLYRKLLGLTGRVMGQARRFSSEIASGVKRSSDVLQQAALEGLKREIDQMMVTVKKVVHQTKARIFGGDTHVEGKVLSVFEDSTEVIRKGKASKPTEFGKTVKIQEAENQIVIDFDVYDQKPSDSDLLIPSIEAHRERMGRTPDLAVADAGFYSAKNVTAAEQMGVKRVSVPNRSTKSAARRKYQKQRWFKRGQKWRTGSEGRISVLKRRHGLRRSLYRKPAGMKRWVGLGVIADNLINIGKAMAK